MSKPVNSTTVESQAFRSDWMSEEVLVAVSECPAPLNKSSFFVLPEQLPHTECDDCGTTNQYPWPQLLQGGGNRCDVRGLISNVDESQSAYVGLLTNLNTALEVSIETELLLRRCFFLQHDLARRRQFEMLGMIRCAHHSRIAESRLAVFPPVHKHYPLQELPEDVSRQLEQLRASPRMMYQLITTFKLHMTKQTLPLPQSAGVNASAWTSTLITPVFFMCESTAISS